MRCIFNDILGNYQNESDRVVFYEVDWFTDINY